MAENNSLIEMGSLELVDEILVSPAAISRKTPSLDAAPNRSFYSDGTKELNLKSMWNSVLNSIKVVLFSDKINLLVPFGPVAILVDELTSHHGWVFFLSLLGIIPLAERLGWATEQLACYTGNTVGGLLNATFGNATELIISMYAMKNGMIRVVQQSLLGSILSNMLLVLGCAFFSGGIVHPNKEQMFNKGTAVMNSGLLLMAVMGLLFPAVLHFTHTELHFGKSEMALSRFSSCVMLVAYGAYLFFQLTSQKNLYSPINEEDSHQDGSLDDEETPQISKWESIIWLSVLTAWISALSEYLVNAIEGGIYCYEYSDCIHKCYFTPHRWKCSRTCRCNYVCHERQACCGKGTKRSIVSRDSKPFCNIREPGRGSSKGGSLGSSCSAAWSLLILV